MIPLQFVRRYRIVDRREQRKQRRHDCGDLCNQIVIVLASESGNHGKDADDNLYNYHRAFQPLQNVIPHFVSPFRHSLANICLIMLTHQVVLLVIVTPVMLEISNVSVAAFC